jgi:CheY-like chemotaxis protein
MKLWNRLGYRISVFILLLAVVPLAGFGITTINDFRRVRLDSVEQIQKGITTTAAGKIESSLADLMQEIQLVIRSNDLDKASVSDQEWILQLLLKTRPKLYSLALADMDGQEKLKVGREAVYSQKDLEKLQALPTFQKEENPKPIIGGLHRTTANLLLLDMYIPLFSPLDRRVTAVLIAQVNVEKLLAFIVDLRVGKTGYAYVVDAEGRVLVHPDHSVVLAGQDRLVDHQVRNFVSGQKVLGSNSIYTNYQHIQVLTNSQEVAEPRMLVVFVQSVDEALGDVTHAIKRQVVLLLLALVGAVSLSLYFTLKTFNPLRRLESGARLIGSGDLAHRIPVTSSDELGIVTQSFNGMAENLEAARRKDDEQNWLKEGASELDNLLRGDQSLDQLCSNIITFMATYLQKQVGVIYVQDGQDIYRYKAGYAFKPGKHSFENFRSGEGLPGQAVSEKKILMLSNIPDEYFSITSGLGDLVPRHLVIVPFVFNDRVEAVMEMGSFIEVSEQQRRFLEETADSIAIILASARSRLELNNALVRTSQQAEELQRQQEELQASNEEMEEQTQLLMASEAKLKEQQEELQVANEELEEKTQFLERNKINIEEKNQVLERLREDLERKAEDLAVASKYKSEFLANMSHELRTPLNSLLLLARLLLDNKEGNLTKDQVESADIIYNSGNELLALINEILDLSKIEAGKMQLHRQEITPADVGDALRKNFSHLAEEKGISLKVTIKENTPAVIVTDRQRLEQVLKNFISNAFKFTDQGGVTIEFYQPDTTVSFSQPGLDSRNAIAIDIHDTGIGIPQDKQNIIFEAFQQIEGGSARKYGGTGLGLSISREITRLLGGEIHLHSQENIGSTFTLILPIKAAPAVTDSLPIPEVTNRQKRPEVTMRAAAPTDTSLQANPLEDDRNTLSAGDKTLLIIEDDLNFAKTLLNFCREKGFKCIISPTGEEGLLFAEKHHPQAIILDINLPGMNGWAVLESLKENSSTRHIPVHFISADEPVSAAYAKGAIGYLTKPVSRENLEQALASLDSLINKKTKDLLLVEDDANQRRAIIKLIGDSDVVIHEASTGREAIEALQSKQYDCMILDLGLPDMSGFDLLQLIEKDNTITIPPVVVYTGKDLTLEEENELRKYSESIIVKGVRSEERLLDETSLFLHRMVEKLPIEKRKMILDLHDSDQMLRNRTILLVDDDMRNVFALSKVLGEKGINTIKAENGIKALEILKERNDIDLVLMDIMMPIMDGYETMRRIRAEGRFNTLPIIALTAKAMQRDKDDCIKAGANDYLAKPVEIDRLLSMMRVWLYR